MQQHGSKYFACRPLPRLWVWGQNPTFSEHGHIAYLIRWNLVAYIMIADPLDPGSGSKGQNSTFSEYGHVAYQNKENSTCNRVAW